MLNKKHTYLKKGAIISLWYICIFVFLPGILSAQNEELAPANAESAQEETEIDRNSYISETKSVMDEDVKYSAKDSIVMLSDGTVIMYNESKVIYGDIELSAYYIRLNRDSNMVYAEGVRDSNGVLTQKPVFVDAGTSYKMETIRYNFISGKGLIYNVSTEQADGFVNGGVTKRMEDESFSMKNGRYTTCDCEEPHFYLKMTKAKVRPGKNIVTGPAYLVMEGVPLPLAIPFGFFPFTESYSSGFIMPSYGEEQNRGFYLKGGGYYFALSDFMDLSLTGDIYTLGSWGLNASSRYKKRYKFNGNFAANYRVNVTGDKETDDYLKSKDFSVRWTHTQDAKASPYSSFSASVNFSSSSYEANDLDRIYYTNSSNNHKSSSISFSQRFPEAPINLSLSANLSQNAADSSITVSLPQFAFSLNRVYPFKFKNRKPGKDRWYEKIGVSYSANISNSYSGNQAELATSNIIKDWKNGMKHSIPVSTSFQLLKNITVSPSISYNERWYTSKVEQSFDTINNAVLKDTVWGFNRVYDYSTSVSLSTKLYGMYQPWKIFGDKVQAIRHVMTPSVSLGWRPDFADERYGYYDTYQRYNEKDSTWTDVQYSLYQGSLYGTPGAGKNGSVGLSLGNNVEMKVRNDRDTTSEFRKIKLIDRLNFSTSYNMMADSLKWSNISASLGFTIFKKSVNISAAFDPYSYDSNGRKINTSYLEDHNKLLRLTRASTSMGFSITDKKLVDFINNRLKKKDGDTDGDRDDRSDSNLEEDEAGTSEGDYDDDGYLKISIPWSLNFSYSIGLNSVWDKELEDYKFETNSNLSMSGNISLTDKWKLSVSSGYNFTTKKMASTRFSVTRDLHCWSMSASFVPIGTLKSYNFTIRINSQMLSDIKYDKRSSPYDNGIWE